MSKKKKKQVQSKAKRRRYHPKQISFTLEDIAIFKKDRKK